LQTHGLSQLFTLNAHIENAIEQSRKPLRGGIMRLKSQAIICLIMVVVILCTFVLKQNAETLFEIADAILQGKGEPSSPTEILCSSIKNGDLSKAKRMISQGVSVNTRNKNGETLLMIAAASGNVDSVRLLLNQGADIAATDRAGQTALFYAAVGKDSTGNIVQLLLDAKANPNTVDYNGSAPLYQAADFGSFENIKALLKGGAKPNVKNEGGRTPLHIRVSWGDAKAAELLLDFGAEVNGSTGDGWTPLMVASIGGHADAVRLLLKKGADPNSKNASGKTALTLTEEVNQEGVQSIAHKNREGIIELLKPITKN
jgi:ankyrin repeat protein